MTCTLRETHVGPWSIRTKVHGEQAEVLMHGAFGHPEMRPSGEPGEGVSDIYWPGELTGRRRDRVHTQASAICHCPRHVDRGCDKQNGRIANAIVQGADFRTGIYRCVDELNRLRGNAECRCASRVPRCRWWMPAESASGKNERRGWQLKEKAHTLDETYDTHGIDCSGNR